MCHHGAVTETFDRDGIRIAYDTHGRPEDPTLLLIMGLGSSRKSWDPDFVDAAVARGFFVVVFDNRDVGDSTWIDTPDLDPATAFQAVLAGDRSAAFYQLTDMAADTAALIDHLGRGAVHVLGISMGGMIAQQLAIDHPETVASLTSIMSTTGAADVGAPAPDLLPVLMDQRPTEREASIDHGVAVMEATFSPDHWDPVRARARSIREVDAGINPLGSTRQLLAILASADRSEALATVSVPTLVVHGSQDRLVAPNGGEATAAAIPAAHLLLISDMAHDLPVAHWDRILDAVAHLGRTAPPTT